MKSREEIYKLLKEQLERAQQRIKHYTDKRRSERELQVGDEVYLKLQPYKQTSVAVRRNLKLASKYYGPYKVTLRVGSVAYKLELPDTSRIHPIFHISLLERKIGEGAITSREPPELTTEGQMKVYPALVLDKRMVKRQNRAVTQLLIQWLNLGPENATWEF
ncbi:hypothetical protein HRI_002351600 [Hibiscus trionum]|uniref:Tf2-1-like SH3-like domain-containing protein n=1 Tax=Hibiscus trionum TaxID=183268 RepID=A0A9W7M3U2_HIBTR|nr:hypothetical protein HRI_002351600 [Hibiscus trionum]